MTGIIDGVIRSTHEVTIVNGESVCIYDCAKDLINIVAWTLASSDREDRLVEYDVEDGKIVKIVRMR